MVSTHSLTHRDRPVGGQAGGIGRGVAVSSKLGVARKSRLSLSTARSTIGGVHQAEHVQGCTKGSACSMMRFGKQAVAYIYRSYSKTLRLLLKLKTSN